MLSVFNLMLICASSNEHKSPPFQTCCLTIEWIEMSYFFTLYDLLLKLLLKAQADFVLQCKWLLIRRCGRKVQRAVVSLPQSNSKGNASPWQQRQRSSVSTWRKFELPYIGIWEGMLKHSLRLRQLPLFPVARAAAQHSCHTLSSVFPPRIHDCNRCCKSGCTADYLMSPEGIPALPVEDICKCSVRMSSRAFVFDKNTLKKHTLKLSLTSSFLFPLGF